MRRFATLAIIAVIAVAPSVLSAQVASTRLVRVTVTDHFGRSVTGLEQENFEVVDNGVLCPVADCPITNFSEPDSPMALAVVSETPVPKVGKFVKAEDELIQTRSVADAVRQLAVSKKPRKVILSTISSDIQAIPDGIQVFQTTPAGLSNALYELGELHEYLLWVKSSAPSLSVVLKPPADLPPLRLTSK